MGLVDRVYDLAESFPAREGYGLTSQVTRAVVSVPANIAEGQARSTAKDFANFLAIASDADAGEAFSQITEVSKMLTSLRSRLAARKGAR